MSESRALSICDLVERNSYLCSYQKINATMLMQHCYLFSTYRTLYNLSVFDIVRHLLLIQDTIHTVYYAWAMQQLDPEEGGGAYSTWKLREMQQLGVRALI